MKRMIGRKWDMYFLMEAWLISTRSKDPSTQTGAVIVNPQKKIISKGYNGLPMRMPDKEHYYTNRELKYNTIIHCEENALIFAKQDLEGCCLYTWPFLSCSRCASKMIQAGITRVVAPKNTIERWEENLNLGKTNFNDSDVSILEYDKEEVISEIKKLVVDKLN